MAVYGRGFMELNSTEQRRILAFVDLRDEEEALRAKSSKDRGG